MQTPQLFILFALLTSLVSSSIIKEEKINGQFIIVLHMENDEEIIDFDNQEGVPIDQVQCSLSNCHCQFKQENNESGQIANTNCDENTLTLIRTNTNVTAIQKERQNRMAVEVYSDSDMTNSKTVDSRLTIKWKFNTDGTIEFATIWNKKTWLGIGFGSSMSNSDMITINVSGSTVNLIDLYSTSQNTPSTDSSQDYTLISYEVGSASVKTRFRRKLSTGDSKDKTLTKGSSYSWCYAYSSALSMERHSVYLGFSITLSESSGGSTGSTGTSSGSTGTSSDSTTDTNTSTSTDTESGSDNESDNESESESHHSSLYSEKILFLGAILTLIIF